MWKQLTIPATELKPGDRLDAFWRRFGKKVLNGRCSVVSNEHRSKTLRTIVFKLDYLGPDEMVVPKEATFTVDRNEE